ncbi:MAG: rhodanese-like domain-containing protein [Aeromicrobium sp.]|nr:MAG: rhodanese-like domain-containing protein [Aeromicrobium sp.]
MAATLFVTGCSSSTDTVTISDSTVIIDVRSPEEFAQGHLEGAELIDFNAGDLEAALTELDPDAEYVVYCRSGNRSSQAVAMMEDAGFTNVTDLGSLESAAKVTGLEIVQ